MDADNASGRQAPPHACDVTREHDIQAAAAQSGTPGQHSDHHEKLGDGEQVPLHGVERLQLRRYGPEIHVVGQAQWWQVMLAQMGMTHLTELHWAS